LYTDITEEDISESPKADTPHEEFSEPKKNPFEGSKGKVVKKI